MAEQSPSLWTTLDGAIGTAAKVYSRKLELEAVKTDSAARAWMDGAHAANQVQRNNYTPDPSPQRQISYGQAQNQRIALYLAGGAVVVLTMAAVMAMARGKGK